jgi:hypothetical protein
MNTFISLEDYTMSRFTMPTAYFIPVGNIVDTGVKPEGYPLPFENDVKGELPRYFGSKVYTGTGYTGYIVPRTYTDTRNTDDSLSFGGVSGHNFLVRNTKIGGK